MCLGHNGFRNLYLEKLIEYRLSTLQWKSLCTLSRLIKYSHSPWRRLCSSWKEAKLGSCLIFGGNPAHTWSDPSVTSLGEIREKNDFRLDFFLVVWPVCVSVGVFLRRLRSPMSFYSGKLSRVEVQVETTKNICAFFFRLWNGGKNTLNFFFLRFPEARKCLSTHFGHL